MTDELSAADKRRLRAAAHPLKPVVIIGNNGYTEAIGAAIDEALSAHELIKVRLRGIESGARAALAAQICDAYGAANVGIIGSVLTLYRPNPDDQAAMNNRRNK